MDTTRYNEALNRLNPKQREAVETIDGPVMVIAGPGTGKTQILSMRIAYILAQTDTQASNILALTFTESGTTSIRRRLLELVGKSAYDVNVHTFHGFANSIIQTHPDHFPSIIGGRQCEPIEQIEILQSIIERNSYEYLKPFGNQFYYVNPIITTIQELKREGYTPDKFELLLEEQTKDFNNIEDLYHEKGKYEGRMKGAYVTIEKKISKNRELLSVYKQYEEEKSKQGLYDYDDMIIEVLRALETDEDFLLMLQERYLYILADEHQDANRSQNRLLELLSSFHDNPNIFVVGDDKQAIYRFQGASLENFLYFRDRYPDAHVVDLEENYRSTQHILDIAGSLISNNPTISLKPLVAKSDIETITTTITPATTEVSEADFVAKEVKKLLDSGEKPEEIAILYRYNRHAELVREALINEGVEYSLEGAAAETPHIITEQFLDVLDVISDPLNESKLSQTLFYSFFNLSPSEIFLAINEKQRDRLTLIEYAAENPDNRVSKVISLIMSLHKEARNSTLRTLFDSSLEQTNLLETIIQDPDANRAMGEIKTLFELVKKMERAGENVRIEEYLSLLKRAKEYGISLFSSSNHKKPGVQLMTVHRSKGLEFNSVFIIGAIDSNWGGRKRPEQFYLPELKALDINESERAKEDERRLFFVALTRARRAVYISYYLESKDGREEIESQFISELGENITTHELYKCEPQLEKGRISVQVSLLDKDLISSYFFSRGLSATAVNKYLRCSWDYFFTSLVRVPQTYSTSALFGTAMHGAMQKYFSGRNSSDPSAEETAKEELRLRLFQSQLSEADAERFFERGVMALEGYFKNYGSLQIRKSELEKTVRVNIELEGGMLKLSGNLDRVEEDESGGFIVTDFKTGNPRSRNDLEGKTKNSTGDYKRQLVFYSLLLEESGKNMTEGIIDFIEPNPRGIYKRESFSITKEERDELREVIKSINEDLTSLSFASKGCKEKTCEWCRLAGFLENK